MIAQPAKASHPSPESLGVLAALGAGSALWAQFLWTELVRARSGGTPFCPLGEPGQCGALWDGPFAAAIHRLTGLPVAGWGVAWGLVALMLPLVALVRLAEGRPLPALVTAIRAVAAAGVLSVLVFLGVSAAAGQFCVGCFATYVLVAGYAGIALQAWRRFGLPQPERGIALAGGATAAAFLALLYPGLRTPRSAAEAGQKAVAAAGSVTASPEIVSFVASLEPQLKQTLSDALFLYRNGSAFPLPAARRLIGSKDAPIRITDFSDIRCEHCAQLHETLRELARVAPAGSFGSEPRQFPLDGECNPAVQRAEDPVRCLAAKALICFEDHPQADEYAGKLFAKQTALTAPEVYSIAAPYRPRAELERCVASAETARKLREDIELALKYEPDGTPIVLINGRKASAFAPFLYAMVLTRGSPDHPAFASLPPANPSAHMH
jgi:serine/threonine-protein kinase